MRLVSAAEMARIDRASEAHAGVPSLLLMEHAALACVAELRRALGGLAGARIPVLVGPGMNGGDGLAIARLLARARARVTVVLAADPARFHGAAALNWGAVRGLGIPVTPAEAEADLGGDHLVDALLGTGATGAPRGPVAARIEAAVRAGTPSLAVDLPSGLPADGGAPPGAVLPAARTVTMGLPKPFFVCPVARDWVGEATVARIGFPEALLAGGTERVVVAGVAAGGLPPRPAAGHKGVFGKVLVVGGAPGMYGAPMLAARGALRAGAGLVKVLAPAEVRASYGAGLPEAMVHAFEDEGPEGLARLAAWADVVVVGPGLGESPVHAEALARLVAGHPGTVVVDADGLRLLPAGEAMAGRRVLTPHPGELARVLGTPVGKTWPARRAALAEALARHPGATVVLKGRFTLVGEGDRVGVIAPGGPGLATGGTGDVLAGGIAALLAAEAAISRGARVEAACWLHAVAGDLAGDRGVRASEVADLWPDAVARAVAVGPGGDPHYPACLPEDRVRVFDPLG